MAEPGSPAHGAAPPTFSSPSAAAAQAPGSPDDGADLKGPAPAFPLARVRKIMKEDKDVQKMSSDGVAAVAFSTVSSFAVEGVADKKKNTGLTLGNLDLAPSSFLWCHRSCFCRSSWKKPTNTRNEISARRLCTRISREQFKKWSNSTFSRVGWTGASSLGRFLTCIPYILPPGIIILASRRDSKHCGTKGRGKDGQEHSSIVIFDDGQK